MPCEGCTHAMTILDDDCKETPAREVGEEMDAYIKGINPCPFKEELE